MFIYYVYAYINKKKGLPYYIGKGKGERCFADHKHISVPKDRSKIIFLETNLSNIGACAIERRMIRWYGRKIDGSGILLNTTEGGDGFIGKHSKKSKTKNSISQKERYSKLSKEEIELMYASRKGREPWNKGVKQGPHKNPRKPYSEEARAAFKGPRGPGAALKAWETKRNKLNQC